MTARDVESKLESSFQLAQAWDCVLLLDEADIFLAARRNTDLERNALVSGRSTSTLDADYPSLPLQVFLRVLEYYEGILFLTTNRVGSVDEAFKSRIHMALYYPPLDRQKTVQIWRSQLRRVKSRQDKKVEVDEDRIIDFAKDLFDKPQQQNGNTLRWNGRQIRNAFQSALAIAEYVAKDGVPVKLEISHFEKVAKASSEFDYYLSRVHHGRTDADNALSNMMRDDAFELHATSFDLVQQPMASQYETRTNPSFGRARTPITNPSMPQYTQPMTPQQGYTPYGVAPTQYSPASSMQTFPQSASNMQGYQPQHMMTTPTRQSHMQSNLIPRQGFQMQQAGVPLQQASAQIQQEGVSIPQGAAQQAMPSFQQVPAQSQPPQTPHHQGQQQQGFPGEGFQYA